MKTKMMLLLMISLLAAAGMAQAQSDYKHMSRAERSQRMDELLYFDLNDMSISTDSAQFIKSDLELFGSKRESRNTWMIVGGITGALICAVVTGLCMEEVPVLAVVGGAGMVAGFVVWGIGCFDTKAERLLEKSRLMVDASIPLWQHDNLALGVSMFHNNVDRSTVFGPSMSIRF